MVDWRVNDQGHHRLLKLGVVKGGQGAWSLGVDTLYMDSLIDTSLQGIHRFLHNGSLGAI